MEQSTQSLLTSLSIPVRARENKQHWGIYVTDDQGKPTVHHASYHEGPWRYDAKFVDPLTMMAPRNNREKVYPVWDALFSY
uniref:Uncharacterized protein n=1 Tax=Gibberella zeae TaxID=5518 RepID=A0A4E9DU51_GIBZA